MKIGATSAVSVNNTRAQGGDGSRTIISVGELPTAFTAGGPVASTANAEHTTAATTTRGAGVGCAAKAEESAAAATGIGGVGGNTVSTEAAAAAIVVRAAAATDGAIPAEIDVS